MKKKKRNHWPTFKEIIHPNNPYHWYGFILIIIGILGGGAVGAGIAFIVGSKAIALGKNYHDSNVKKVVSLTIYTMIGLALYLIVAVIVFAY